MKLLSNCKLWLYLPKSQIITQNEVFTQNKFFKNWFSNKFKYHSKTLVFARKWLIFFLRFLDKHGILLDEV